MLIYIRIYGTSINNLNTTTMALIIWILCGISCMLIADKKGYNKGLALILGFLGGVISLIVYACLGNKNK